MFVVAILLCYGISYIEAISDQVHREVGDYI